MLELEILKLLVKGCSTKGIVHMPGLSVGIILDKLDAFDRTSAVAKAIERGILHLGAEPPGVVPVLSYFCSATQNLVKE